jgi:hypothetical protein
MKVLDKAEEFYAKAVQELKPEIEAVKKALSEQSSTLNGPQRAFADSVMAVADSCAALDRMFQARDTLARLEKLMPALLANEKKAQALKPRIVGTWKEVAQPDGIGFTAVQTTIFKLGKDGDMEISEEKKGTSNVALKEDWKFLSWGNWELKGDTLLMHVSREKLVRQIFDILTKKPDGSTYWKHKVAPTYDTTITDGRKDKQLTYTDLKATFKKIR